MIQNHGLQLLSKNQTYSIFEMGELKKIKVHIADDHKDISVPLMSK